MSFLQFFTQLFRVYWRSLLLLLFSVCLPLSIFGALALTVWHHTDGLIWDQSILLLLHAHATPQLDRWARGLTKLGVFWGVFPVTLLVSLFLLRLQRWRSLVYLVTTLLGSIVINRTVKVLLHRIRPSLWDLPTPDLDYSFPSGHAMSSMTLVVALVVLTWGSRWCGFVLVAGISFVVAIGWTRLYLGVHFPSDVLAGWMVSIAWATGVSLLIQPHLSQAQAVDEATLRVEEKSAILQEHTR